MPSNTSSSVFYYVYVLQSSSDGKMYIGITNNLRKRVVEHNKGKSKATEPRKPFKLIYFEACTDRKDAKRREEYLKKSEGRKFLALRLKEYKKSFGALGSRG